MAMNFKIFQLKRSHSVHLNLDGDFDGTSAHELINTLKSCGPDIHQVELGSGVEILHPPHAKVVHDDDLVSLIDKTVHQMRSDEPCATRNQNLQRAVLPMMTNFLSTF